MTAEVDKHSGWGPPRAARAMASLPPLEEMKGVMDRLNRDHRALAERVAAIEKLLADWAAEGDAASEEPPPQIIEKANAELEELRARARELGVPVDARWGYKRLAAEIARAEDAKGKTE